MAAAVWRDDPDGNRYGQDPGRRAGQGVEHFHQDTGRYPTDEEGLEGLIKPPAADANWKGPYVNEELLTDPWGVAYQYHFPPSQPQVPFDLFSFGKDRTLGGVGDNKDITYGDN